MWSRKSLVSDFDLMGLAIQIVGDASELMGEVGDALGDVDRYL